jgi:hypothetical protein
MRISESKFQPVSLFIMLTVLAVVILQKYLSDKTEHIENKKHPEYCFLLDVTNTIPGEIHDEEEKEALVTIEFVEIRTKQDKECDLPKFYFKIVNNKTGIPDPRSLSIGLSTSYEPPDIGWKYTLYLLNTENGQARFLIQRGNK